MNEIREKELDKTCPIAYQEIVSGGSKKLKEFLKTHDDYLYYAVNLADLVMPAVKCDNVEALKAFLDAGMCPDSIREGDDWLRITPLWTAIQHRAYNAITCLLDAGADINRTENGKEPSPLIQAAGDGDIYLVKMFLERGADLHYTYLFHGKEKFNALKWAVTEGHQEVADYLRSQGAVMPEEKEMPPTNPDEELLADLSRHFKGKPLKFGLGEIVPASVPMMVHIFPPVKGKRKNTIFVSSGLIEYVLEVPKGQEKYRYAEYFIEMPGAWPVKDKDLEQEKNFWPIRWLKAISRYPHEQTIYYGDKAIVDAKMIPTFITPDGKYDSALVERCEDLTLRVSDGRLVIYYRITPRCSGEE